MSRKHFIICFAILLVQSKDINSESSGTGNVGGITSICALNKTFPGDQEIKKFFEDMPKHTLEMLNRKTDCEFIKTEFLKHKKNILEKKVNETGNIDKNDQHIEKNIFDEKEIKKDKINAAVKTALGSLSTQFNDENQKKKNYEFLYETGVIQNVSIEHAANSSILKNTFQTHLMEFFVQRHFDNHFKNNSKLNKKFATFIAGQEKLLDTTVYFRIKPDQFAYFNNDPTIIGFIDENKKEQIENVFNLSGNILSLLQSEKVWNQIDALTMFNVTRMESLLSRPILKLKVKENFQLRFEKESNDVIELFVNFSEQQKKLKNYDVSYEQFKEINFKNDKNMNDFIGLKKRLIIKTVLSRMNRKNINEELLINELLNDKNAFKDVSMMFDVRVMENFLNEKISIVEFKDFLNKQFKNSETLNNDFITHLIHSGENLEDYKLPIPQFYNLRNNSHMISFIELHKDAQVKAALTKLHPKKNDRVQQYFAYFQETNVLENIDVKMMFHPNEMVNFIRNEFTNDCRYKFESILNDKPEAWGRTPNKCIIDPVCINIKELWSRVKVAEEISKYPIAERTFDEVDEMFLDLISNDMKTDRNYTTDDIDCLLAFVKRTNVEENWYNIALITDDRMRNQKLEAIKAAYKKSVGKDPGTKATLRPGNSVGNPRTTTGRQWRK